MVEDIKFIKHIYDTTTDEKLKKEIEEKYPVFMLHDNVARYNDVVELLDILYPNASEEVQKKIELAKEWLSDNKQSFTRHGDKLIYKAEEYLIWAADDIEELMKNETDEEKKNMYAVEIATLKMIANTFPDFQFDDKWLKKVGDFIWENRKGDNDEIAEQEEWAYRLWSGANRKIKWNK